MRHDNRNRNHQTSHTSEPNLFDFVPKNVWREVYRGRWRELRAVQKAEFVVEIVFFTLFIGGIAYNTIQEGNWLGLVLSFGIGWLILGAFFYLLTRFIR